MPESRLQKTRDAYKPYSRFMGEVDYVPSLQPVHGSWPVKPGDVVAWRDDTLVKIDGLYGCQTPPMGCRVENA